MNLNPEFQRQLYLECSQARLIGIPLVLAAIFSLGYLIDGDRLGSTTARMALTLFMLGGLLWGARQTADSIVEEYRDRTWDTQRLSALGAWEMTWGKLFGSTVMVWYAGSLCLAVYALASPYPTALPGLLFYCVCAALLAQSGGLLLGLLAVQRGQSNSGSILLLAVVGFIAVAPWLSDVAEQPAGYFGGFSPTPLIEWYELNLSAVLFHRLSLLAALSWCAVGNYRLMAQALGLRHQQSAWLGFCLFLIVYLGGFIPASSYSFSLAAFAVCAALTYLGVLVERNEAMRLKRLLRYIGQRNWRRCGEEMPIWWPTLLLTLLFTIPLSLSEHPVRLLSAEFHFYPSAIALLLLRDCALYLYFCYGKNPQRAFGLSLLTGVLLYGVVPGIFATLGLTGMAALFFPLWADSAGGALMCALIQTALVLQLLYRRWRQSV